MQNKHMLETCKGKEKSLLKKSPLYMKTKINIIVLLGSVNGDIIKVSSVLLYSFASILAKPCKRPKIRKDPQ